MEFSRLLGVCLALMIALTVAMAGCNRSALPANVKVSGKVVDAQGRPVTDVTIRFFPLENVERYRVDKFTINYPYAGTNNDGKFTLSMNAGDVEGAPPGKYRVIVSGFTKEQKRSILAVYEDMGNSPLEVTIPNHDVHDLVVKLESP